MTLRIGRLPILSLIVLLSVGLAGCAGSPAGTMVDAANRPGGLWAVVPCRHEPDIGDAVRSAVLVRKPKTCQAQWTHPTASQEQLVEDMTARSKAAFWVLSPSAAQDQRLACMESKGYRRDSQQNAQATSTPVTAKVDEEDAPRGLVQEPPPNPSSETVTSPTPDRPASELVQEPEASGTPIAAADNATTSLESQLKRLDDLRARSVISEDEQAVLHKHALESGLATPPGPAASL